MAGNGVPSELRADGSRYAGGPLRRVDLLIGKMSAGGAETQLLLLARGLRDRGIATRVLAMFSGGSREVELVDAGVELVHLEFARRGERGSALRNLRAFARFVRLLRRTRPDVLHAFLFHNYLVAAPAARLARVPAMVAGRLCLGSAKERRPLLLALERVVNLMTDLVVANAEAVAADTRAQEKLPDKKIVVLYNGMPDEAFIPAVPAEIDTELPVVLCVANLHPYKGHRYLIDAAAQLRERGIPVTVVLAGDGVERETLRQQAEKLGVDVRLLGVRRDVRQLLARADVAVLPSETEGLSNAIMEAMAAGTPVVATDVGGTPELLRDRGVMVPPADAEALADGLYSVLSDPDRAGRMAAAARDWSRAHLHVDTMVDGHVTTYAELLRARAAGR